MKNVIVTMTGNIVVMVVTFASGTMTGWVPAPC
jgi:hypothetical protein